MIVPKYGHLVKRNPMSNWRHIYPLLTAYTLNTEGQEDWGGVPFCLGFFCLDKPFLMVDEPHTHDFEQFLIFLGGNSMHIEDFDAEIELYLGPEQEKHLIMSPTIVHIPKGLVHCPLNFKVINKPIVFMDCMLTPEYIRKPLAKK